MTRQINLGKTGEELAAGWLTNKRFKILCRNWRHGRYEVDIIASRAGILHIIEVKCRQSKLYGHPEESVSRRKFQNVMRGASAWLLQYPGHQRLQYDVLAITLPANHPPEFFLIEDVYL